MKFVSASCPNCNGELQVPEEKDFVNCLYCGKSIKVREAIKVMFDNNIPNLISLGNESFKAGNYLSAYDYYNKVLESDINNGEVWYSKAMTCGHLSTSENNRANEMFSYFEKSILCYPESDRPAMQQKVANELYEFSKKTFEDGNKEMNQDITNKKNWQKYSSSCKSLITILEKVYQYQPSNLQVLNLLLSISRDIIQGRNFKIKVISGSAGKWTWVDRNFVLDSSYLETIKGKWHVWNENLLNLDDEYKQRVENNNKFIEIQNIKKDIRTKYYTISYLFAVFLFIVITVIILMTLKLSKDGTTALIFLNIFICVIFGTILGYVISNRKIRNRNFS